jgi:hypothetical protein
LKPGYFRAFFSFESGARAGKMRGCAPGSPQAQCDNIRAAQCFTDSAAGWRLKAPIELVSPVGPVLRSFSLLRAGFCLQPIGR